MQDIKYEKTWNLICNRIKEYDVVDAAQINAFFSRLYLQAFSEGFIMLTADNDFIKNWIERHYIELIKRACSDLYQQSFIVNIEVDETQQTQTTAPNATISMPSPTPLQSNNALSAKDHSIAESSSTPLTTPTFSESDNTFQSAISNLTFQNYVIGDSNRMAYSMALAVAEHPGVPNLNPLFIYGKSGVGKTHLLRSIQNYINDSFNTSSNQVLKTVYVDSTDFVNDYANASADHSKEKTSFKNFKQKYEAADVLLIDDVQAFQGKTQTLEIIFEIFNRLTTQGKQVVMSADIAPRNIDIDERYSSRFNSGCTYDIQAPEVETKLGIIRSFIKEYQANENRFEFDISEEVELYIAENSSSNIRELKSAVTKIIYEMIYNNMTNITIDEVASILKNHFSGGITKKLSIADIQHEIEDYYHINHNDLISKSRKRNIVNARQVGMYLCRQLLKETSYDEIGKGFGGKDHSTVVYSNKLIEEKIKENKENKEEIDIIIRNIREN